MLEEELEEEAWKEYTANILCMIARPNYETTIPMYSELIAEEKKPENNLTADEIFNNVMDKLDELITKGA